MKLEVKFEFTEQEFNKILSCGDIDLSKISPETVNLILINMSENAKAFIDAVKEYKAE